MLDKEKKYAWYWNKLCEEHTEEGVKKCYTTKCPMVYEFMCYSYNNFSEFLRVTHKGRAIKYRLTQIARKNGWNYEE